MYVVQHIYWRLFPPTFYWPGYLAEVCGVAWKWEMNIHVSSHLSIHIKNTRSFLPNDKGNRDRTLHFSFCCFFPWKLYPTGLFLPSLTTISFFLQLNMFNLQIFWSCLQSMLKGYSFTLFVLCSMFSTQASTDSESQNEHYILYIQATERNQLGWNGELMGLREDEDIKARLFSTQYKGSQINVRILLLFSCKSVSLTNFINAVIFSIMGAISSIIQCDQLVQCASIGSALMVDVGFSSSIYSVGKTGSGGLLAEKHLTVLFEKDMGWHRWGMVFI